MLSFFFLSEAEKAMNRKGWTKKRLAKEIDTSASYLTQLFRGDRLLNFKNIAKIEQALSLKYEITEESNRTEEFKPYIDFFIDSADMENDLPTSRPDYDSEPYESVVGCEIYDLRAAW